MFSDAQSSSARNVLNFDQIGCCSSLCYSTLPPISFFFLFRAEEFTIGHFVSRSLFLQRLAVRIKRDFKPNQPRHFRHLLKSAGKNAANRAEILRHHFRNNPVARRCRNAFDSAERTAC